MILCVNAQSIRIVCGELDVFTETNSELNVVRTYFCMEIKRP